jgi:uncharacterized protein (DUF1015 family)
MARLYPFRALRYDASRVNMTDVVTQPYDKISPAMQERYYDASPYNLIRIILGKHKAKDNDTDNVYIRAAATLKDWRAEGILKEEAEPALYGYSQTYKVPGTEDVRERRGFIALAQLHDYADHVVFRHEQTFPKHKSDRLALFKATRAYCEQIYMLYSDPTFTAEKAIFESGTEPELTITDEYDVVHRLWKLTDPALIERVLAAMADKQLIIADGHHRYETSTTYMHERAAELGLADSAKTLHASPSRVASPFLLSSPSSAEGTSSPGSPSGLPQLPAPAFPEAAMMMTFVNMDAPGITILPTHRVVHGLPNFSSPDFITKASAFFDVKELATPDLAALNSTSGTAFLAATGDGNYLLTPKPGVIAEALKGISPRQAQLEVVQLHSIILDKLLGLDQETITRLGNVRYIRAADEATALVASGEADIAFLIKPITLDQLRDISLSGDVMPQKSTDFYPKLLSGLAIYALD